MRFRLGFRPAIAVILLLILAVVPVAIRTVSEANATHGGNVAIVSMWNEAKKSNAVFDNTLEGSTVVMEVNVTDAVRLKGFDITLRYNIAVLDGISVAFRQAACPAFEGCLFDGNGVWLTGEGVVYDTNDNHIYNTGEPTIRTPAPTVGFSIKNDAKIKYVDTNNNNVWNSGEVVIYDTNSNNQYNTGEQVVTSGGVAPPNGTVVKTDPLIRFSDGSNTTTVLSQVDLTPGVIRLSVTISDTSFPFTTGTGTLFRATFTASLTPEATMINIDEAVSTILDPNPVPYAGIDGFFDDRDSPEFNYSVTPSPNTVSINRPVSGTASSGPITVSVALITGTTRPVNLQAIGLPTGTTASFSTNNANPTFSSTLTLTINGGPAGGATTAPSGTYAVVIAGNATVASHLVRVGYLSLTIVPPPPPTFTVGSSPTSLTLAAGLSTTSTITATLTGGTAEAVTLSASPPAFAAATFSPNPGTPTFSSTMTLTAGSYTEEFVISFTNAPPQNAALETDAKLRIVDADSDGFYDNSEHVVYDTNNNNVYDSGEPDITLLGAVIGSSLSTDPKIKFYDSITNNNVWDSSPFPGEPVVYDYDSSNTYNKELVAVTSAGTRQFNIIATSSGEFSEQTVTVLHEITFTVTNRDVAVTSIAVSRTFAYAGIASQNMVTVGVANQGSIAETFTLSIKLGTITIVGSEPVTVAAGGSTSVSLDFLAPANLTPGSYTLSADIFDPHHPSRGRGAPVWDADPGDNAMTFGAVTVRFGGDVNGDCVVNVSDLAAVGAAFGSSAGPPPSANWNPNADMNNDGVVNVSDLAAVGSRFGTSC